MAEQQNLSEFNRYIINNKQLLIEKHQEYFNSKGTFTIGTLPIPALIDYIYDIFSLARYRNDPRTNTKITNSLNDNIQHFISINAHRANQPFTADAAVEALTYCISHNDMFSVQYDLEKPIKNKGQNGKEETNEPVLNVQFKNDSHFQLQSNNVTPSSNQPSNENQHQKALNSQNNKLAQSEILRKSSKGLRRLSGTDPRNCNDVVLDNEFNQNSDLKKFSDNLDIVKKNARLVYYSYCKNQMQLGGNQTFDRLSEEASTMTIGKLLVYAKAYDLFNQKITKQLLKQRFIRISDGKRSINFQKFYILLTQLLMMDQTLFQRLQFHDQHLHAKLKFVKYPFYTQDQKPRELVPFRGFSNKLTAHSGKTHQELREEIKLRRSQLANRSLIHHNHRDEPRSHQKQKILSPRDLAAGGRSRDLAIELSFIDKIVSPQDNDHKYLGDYQIEHYHNNETSASSSMMLKRKDSIVENIRKRIQEIQHSENEVTRPGPRGLQRRRYQLA